VARAEAYLHAKFYLDPSNRLATVHQHYRHDRQTGQNNDPEHGILDNCYDHMWHMATALYIQPSTSSLKSNKFKALARRNSEANIHSAANKDTAKSNLCNFTDKYFPFILIPSAQQCLINNSNLNEILHDYMK